MNHQNLIFATTAVLGWIGILGIISFYLPKINERYWNMARLFGCIIGAVWVGIFINYCTDKHINLIPIISVPIISFGFDYYFIKLKKKSKQENLNSDIAP